MNLLEVRDLDAGYHGARVLRGFELTVGQGEVVALLGANGAGKTTTLRAVSGLLTPMSGSVRLRGDELVGRQPQHIAQAGLVHMSDRRGIFHGLTVEEHFRLRVRGARIDADTAYAYFPALARLRDRRAGLLSGGEQQMLGLGRALARRPAVLMVDELSQGLAPVVVERLMPILRRYADETGAGVLLVEQQIQMALEIADRGYVLAHGNLVRHDTAAALLANRELIMAGYLGEAAPDTERNP